MKRSGRFYFRNEKETLKSLGLTPAPMSGAGWVIKEDGENDVAIVQLKSTDSSSYRLDMLDMKKLEYHADEAHKVPIFLVQFLKQNKIYAIVSVENLVDIYEALEHGQKPKRPVEIEDLPTDATKRVIKSTTISRDRFYKQKERNEQKLYGKRKRY